MTHPQLTCVVPTHNRPHFLRRLLAFYGQFPPGYPLLVVDSSEPLAAEQNLAAIQSWQGKLDIEYRHFNLGFNDKCAAGLKLVRTPFVAMCADDDILFPDAVRQCAEFLEQDSRYASVMGRTAQLDVKLPTWYCTLLKGYSIDDDEPLTRCRRMVDIWFTNFYAVYRAETLQANFEIIATQTDPRQSVHMVEMMMTQLSVLRGRVKILPVVYSLLERHDANTSGSHQIRVRPQAELHYDNFRRCLAGQFEQVGVGRNIAEKFIDDAYGFFRETNQKNRRRPRSTTERLRRFGRQMTGLTLDLLGRDDRSGSTVARLVRARDIIGCETVWEAAVKLMCEFPQGIPSDPSAMQRCA